MNEEIKEILNEMKDICDVWVKVDGDMKSYNQDQMHCIYDYITNLQEEVNKLTAESTEWESKCYDLQEENERLNNIIDEIEKLADDYDLGKYDYQIPVYILKELKEGKEC